MKGKRTFQPNTRRRKKTHGFRVRMATKNGRIVLKRRRAKGTKASDGLRRAIVVVQPLGLMPAERVRRRSNFERAYSTGVRIPARFMTLFVAANGGPLSRLAIAASRKFGAAVERNRAKRLAREIFRRHKMTTGLDVIIVPRREMLDASFDSLESDYAHALDRRHRGQPAGARPARRICTAVSSNCARSCCMPRE